MFGKSNQIISLVNDEQVGVFIWGRTIWKWLKQNEIYSIRKDSLSEVAICYLEKQKNGQLLWLSGIHVHVSTKPVCSGCSDESGCIRRSVKEGYGVAVELRQYFQTLA